MPDSTSFKRCPKCGEIKPASHEYFYRDSKAKDGLKSRCAVCMKAEATRYREQHPDRFAESQRNYRETHRDVCRQRTRNSYIKFQSKRLNYAREYRDRTTQHRKEYAHEYQRRKPAVFIAINHRRRAIVNNLPNTFTVQDWNRALDYFGGYCAVCGRPAGLWHTLAMDHWIPLSSPECPGSVPSNMIPLCHGIDGCNNSKHNKMPDVWLREKFSDAKARRIERRIAEYQEWVK